MEAVMLPLRGLASSVMYSAVVTPVLPAACTHTPHLPRALPLLQAQPATPLTRPRPLLHPSPRSGRRLGLRGGGALRAERAAPGRRAAAVLDGGAG